MTNHGPILQIIMPMAGHGTRFVDQGFSVPKPLIQVDGQPMFLQALSSFQACTLPTKIFCIIQHAHDHTVNMGQRIAAHLPECAITVLPAPTRGAVESACAVRDALNPDHPVVLLDCDLWFACPAFMDFIAKVAAARDQVCGGLVYFTSNEARYSYALLDEGNRVLRTAEKQVISQHALIGSYFFSHASLFLRAADALLEQGVPSHPAELYTSLLFNTLIQQYGVPVQAFAATAYRSFGTPEELARARANVNA